MKKLLPNTNGLNLASPQIILITSSSPVPFMLPIEGIVVAIPDSPANVAMEQLENDVISEIATARSHQQISRNQTEGIGAHTHEAFKTTPNCQNSIIGAKEMLDGYNMTTRQHLCLDANGIKIFIKVKVKKEFVMQNFHIRRETFR